LPAGVFLKIISLISTSIAEQAYWSNVC